MAKKSTTLQAGAPKEKPGDNDWIQFEDPVDLRPLTWKQTRFVENYIQNGGNAGLAYVQAGFEDSKWARSNASHLLDDPRIEHAVKTRRESLQTELNFKKEDALRILVGIATARVSDFMPVLRDHLDRENYKHLGHKEYAIKSIKSTEYGVEIQFKDSQDALNELWDKLGLGEGSRGGNWFDGLGDLMQLVRDVKTKK